MIDLGGRVCFVTGSTHGIGEASAEALASLGASVVVHGRDSVRVAAVCRGIRERTRNQAVTGLVGDFSSLDGVRRLAEEFRARHGRLDVLLNNAGGAVRGGQRTADGFEWHFGVNHLAPFLLTQLLLDRLKSSAPSRIVVVSSEAHRRNPLDLDDLRVERGKGMLAAYGRSKFANLLFSTELARRLAGTGVTANALHPGVVNTNIFSGAKGVMKWLIALTKPLMASPVDGAKTSIYLASSPDVASVTGKYFIKGREAAPDPAVHDGDLARRCWETSAALTEQKR